MPHAKRPSRRSRRVGAVLGTFVCFGVVASCSTDAVKEASIRRLAIGSWACMPDIEDSDWMAFTLAIEDVGRFTLTPDPVDLEAPADAYRDIEGAWKIEDGDLSWVFDDLPMDQRFRVEGFDALTPKSESFTISDPGPFTSASPPDPDRQKILVDAHGTDSVTMQMPEGDPWTCTRQ